MDAQQGQGLFDWMAWSQPVAIFFISVALMLAVMTVLQIVKPTVPRRGFLPLTTTRGDRLFIGLLTSAYVNLAWAGLTDLNQWYGTSIGFVVLALILRWG